MPAKLGSCGVVVRVETIARFNRQVDPADERDPVVDHDRLFVVAMQGPFPGIEGAADFGTLVKEAVSIELPHRRKHLQSGGNPPDCVATPTLGNAFETSPSASI